MLLLCMGLFSRFYLQPLPAAPRRLCYFGARPFSFSASLMFIL